ncbi:MAG: NUDIX domain-containing protein [Thermoplasmata archaeon]
MPRWRRGPSLATDAVWISRGRVLLVRRGRPPFRGSWALPGGFVNPEERVEEAAVREVREETGLTGHPRAIVGVYSGPDRDPRKPVTSVVFLFGGRAVRPKGGDDAAEARWVPLADAKHLAFDHAQVLADALSLIRRPGRPGGARFTTSHRPRSARPR